MERFSIMAGLIFMDLVRHVSATVQVCVATTVGIALLFAATSLGLALNRSIDGALDGLGADAVVYPAAMVPNLAAALLVVEPGGPLLDNSVVEQVRNLGPIRSISVQRHVPVLDSGAHGVLDLVAIEPDTDFTIRQALTQPTSAQLGLLQAYAGSRRAENIGSVLVIGGTSLNVVGKLSETGVGPMDRAIVVSFATAEAIVSAGVRQPDGTMVSGPISGSASGLMVRLKSGYGMQQALFALSGVPGVQLLPGNGIHLSVRRSTLAFKVGSLALAAVTFIVVAWMIGMVYSGMTLMRRRQIGILLALGLRPVWTTIVLLTGAWFCALVGTLSGILLGMASIKAFQRTLVFFWQIDGISFSMPDLLFLLLAAIVCGLLSLITASAGVLIPLTRCKSGEPWLLIRGTEE